MPEAGSDSYARLLRRYVERGVIKPADSVFVQFAGEFDQKVCAEVGLTNCSFGNIAPDSVSSRLDSAARFDAHRMPHADRSFDHVIGHAGLHHCSRPHEALHEMYRMARRLVLFVENQDSALMRLGARLGAVSAFEHSAVRASGGTSGGVDGSAVVNHVYRWTRREVTKTVRTFDPAVDVPIEFFAEWNLGPDRVGSDLLRRRLGIRSEAMGRRLLGSGQTTLNLLARSQGNIFAAGIRKDLAVPRPWVAHH